MPLPHPLTLIAFHKTENSWTHQFDSCFFFAKLNRNTTRTPNSNAAWMNVRLCVIIYVAELNHNDKINNRFYCFFNHLFLFVFGSPLHIFIARGRINQINDNKLFVFLFTEILFEFKCLLFFFGALFRVSCAWAPVLYAKNHI